MEKDRLGSGTEVVQSLREIRVTRGEASISNDVSEGFWVAESENRGWITRYR